jgi:hypothetical protein
LIQFHLDLQAAGHPNLFEVIDLSIPVQFCAELEPPKSAPEGIQIALGSLSSSARS